MGTDDRLDLSTKNARAEEEARLKRMRDKKNSMEAYRSQYNSSFEREQPTTEVINLENSSGEEEDVEVKNENVIVSSDSDECRLVSEDQEDEEDEEEDPQN